MTSCTTVLALMIRWGMDMSRSRASSSVLRLGRGLGQGLGKGRRPGYGLEARRIDAGDVDPRLAQGFPATAHHLAELQPGAAMGPDLCAHLERVVQPGGLGIAALQPVNHQLDAGLEQLALGEPLRAQPRSEEHTSEL